MANPVTNPRFKAWLSSGLPNAGGFLETFAAGTSTPQAVYTNPQLTVAAANPVQLDANGEALIYGSALQYKLVCLDANLVQLWSADFISIGTGSSGSGGGSGGTAGGEWVLSPLTPTFISATSFSVTSDQTGVFEVGRRIQSANTAGIVYSTVQSAVFGSVTTVTVKNTSGVLDSGLSLVYYSLLDAVNQSIPVQTNIAVTFTATSALSNGIAQTIFSTGTGTTAVLIDRLGEFNATSGIFTAIQAGTYTVEVVGYLTGSGTLTTAPPSFTVTKTGPATVQPVGYGAVTTLGTTVYPSIPVKASVALTAGQTLTVSALAGFTGTMSVGSATLAIARVPNP